VKLRRCPGRVFTWRGQLKENDTSVEAGVRSGEDSSEEGDDERPLRSPQNGVLPSSVEGLTDMYTDAAVVGDDDELLTYIDSLHRM